LKKEGYRQSHFEPNVEQYIIEESERKKNEDRKREKKKRYGIQ
jgi:hypothetical protein